MDARGWHDFTNQLGIVIGFTQLVLDATPETDPRREDLLEVLRAAQACVEMLQAEGDEESG